MHTKLQEMSSAIGFTALTGKTTTRNNLFFFFPTQTPCQAPNLYNWSDIFTTKGIKVGSLNRETRHLNLSPFGVVHVTG